MLVLPNKASTRSALDDFAARETNRALLTRTSVADALLLLHENGLPLHNDNQSIITERIFLDKQDPNILHNEITVFDHALTRPWTVDKRYRRLDEVVWYEDNCTEDNHHVILGKEEYFVDGDGFLMPSRKGQAPPDLRYFK